MLGSMHVQAWRASDGGGEARTREFVADIGAEAEESVCSSPPAESGQIPFLYLDSKYQENRLTSHPIKNDLPIKRSSSLLTSSRHCRLLLMVVPNNR